MKAYFEIEIELVDCKLADIDKAFEAIKQDIMNKASGEVIVDEKKIALAFVTAVEGLPIDN